MPFARTLAAAAAFAAVAGLALVALAHDGVHDRWMEQLKQPNGISCCSGIDCAVTSARVGKKGWEAKTPAGDWVEIPDEIIIRDKGNPTGQPFLCFNYNRPLCFVEPIGA